MTVTLLDTGPIVALLDTSEENHTACVEALDGISGALVTCEPVITEACYLLRNVHGAPAAILRNVRDGVFQIPFVLAPEADAIAKLLDKYRTVPMDLADACLVRLAELTGTGRIFTLDGDFEIYRWRGRKRFDLVMDR